MIRASSRLFDQLEAICAKMSCMFAMRPWSACMSTPRAGATAATAMEFASLAARAFTSLVPLTSLAECTRFAKEALKPHAAKEGIAAWSSASSSPRCFPAAVSRAACCLAAEATRGSNSGTATLSRMNAQLRAVASKAIGNKRIAHEKLVPRVSVVFRFSAVLHHSSRP